MFSKEKYYKNLNTKILGHNLIVFDEIHSTNDELLKIAEKENEGTVILSQTQTNGRGRYSRKWFSPKGGLWFSLLLKFPNTGNISILSTVLGVATASAIEKKTLLTVKIKWPNDLIVNFKKIGGILVENKVDSGQIISVIGIGVNLNFLKGDLPNEIADNSTTILEECHKTVPPEIILAEILKQIESKCGFLRQSY